MEENKTYQEAVRIAIMLGYVSSSTLQRHLKIPHVQAVAILNEMERFGIVSFERGNKPRRVLVKAETLHLSASELERIEKEALQIKDDDLYHEVKRWVIERKEASTAEIVETFQITAETVNRFIVKIASQVPSDISRNFGSWSCSQCGYQNIAATDYCTSCFTPEPYLNIRIDYGSESAQSKPEPLLQKKLNGVFTKRATWSALAVIGLITALVISENTPTSKVIIAPLPVASPLPSPSASASPKPKVNHRQIAEATLESQLIERTSPVKPHRSSVKSSGSAYTLGPRGGCYYINGNGNKIYVDHSLCR